MSHEEMSFCELKSKEIVNEVDGRKLGKTCDLVFSPRNGCILGIVAPYNKRGFFFKGQEIYIPFKHILKIGPDVVLVRLTSDLSHPDVCVDMGRDKGRGRHGGHGGHSGHYDGHHDRHESRHKEKEDDCDDEYCDPHSGPMPAAVGGCDNKCEKCMLFDCHRRWKDVAKAGGTSFSD